MFVRMRKIKLSICLILALFAISFGVLAVAAHAADVQLSQFDDSPDPAIRGGNFTYTLSIENNATDIAYGVVLTLPLPATTVYVSSTGTGCSHDGLVPGSVTCNLGDLLGTLGGGSSQAVTLTIRTTAATGATVNAIASVTSTTTDTNLTNNSLTQNTTINNGADLSIAKVASPSSVVAGATVDWTISSQNLGPNNASTITLTDALPGTLTYVSASGTGWSCGHTGANPGGVVTCTRSSAVSGEVLPIIVISTRVTGAVSGTIQNSTTIEAATPADPIAGNNTVFANVTVTTGTDLAITKTVSSPVIGGQNAIFMLRPRNNGPFNASTVVVTDTLPVGFTFVSASSTDAGWSCSAVSQLVTCARTISPYAVGVGVDNNIRLEAISPVVSSTTSYTNYAAISSATPEADLTNNATSLTFNVVPDGRDLSIAKTKTPNPVAQDAIITSHIVVTNLGPSAAPAGSVRITDTLNLTNEQYGYPKTTPTSFYSDHINWSCSLTGNEVRCDYNGSLAVGATAAVDIYTTALVEGTLTNTACAAYTGSTPGDNVSGNNCEERSIISTLHPISPDLAITKTATTASGNATLENNESTITYTITVRNNSAAPSGSDPLPPAANATGMVMTDTIPGYVTVNTGLADPTTRTTGVSVSYVPDLGETVTFNCTTGSTVTCTQSGGYLAPTKSVVFTITVSRPLLSGTLENIATITSTTLGDPDRSNNEDRATVTVDALADVEVVSKSVLPTTVLAGTNAEYTISVRNNGPSSADNVQVIDSLCGGASTDCNYTLISATPTGAGSPCTHDAVAHTVTCNWGNNFISGRAETATIIIMPNWQTGTAVRHFDNTATISTSTREKEDGTDWGNNSKSATLIINPASLDLLVNKTDAAPAGPDPLGFTSTPTGNDNLISYLIRINNNGGPSLATGVRFTDTMTPPAGKRITFVRVSDTPFGTAPSTTSCTNAGVTSGSGVAISTTCTLGLDIASDASVNRYLIFQVMDPPAAGGDTYEDSVTVTSNETDTNTKNNTVIQKTSVRVRADISTDKVPSSETVQIREPFLWTISVTNSGPGDSQETTLTDTLPAGMQYITPAIAAGLPAPYNAPLYSSGAAWTNNNSSPTSGTCTVTGQVITCNFGLLENIKVVTLSVPVRVISYPAGGTTQNCATSSTTEVDPNTANNTSCSSVTVQKSSIAGYVYRDQNDIPALNDNGSMDAGETGISGVQLRLQGKDVYDTDVNVYTVTNGAGYYIFDNLSPSNATGYSITETQPAIYYFDGLDRTPAGVIAGSRTTDVISSIILPSHTALTGYLFGEIPAASIAGYVWADRNNDGIRDAGETTGIPNAQIRLTGTDANGAVNLTTTTGADGSYRFGPLGPGNYTVTETQPAGWNDGLDRAGTIAAITVGTAGNDIITGIVLHATDTAIDYNFGELGGSLAGFVYNDVNNNGIKDPGDQGIQGVIVTLTGTDINGNTVNKTTATGVDGSYLFADLLIPNASGYILTETQPTGYNDGKDSPGINCGTANCGTAPVIDNDTITGVQFAVGANGINYNFGELVSQPAQVSGRVWLDANHDRIDNEDSGYGRAGWLVELIKRVNPLDNSGYVLIAQATTAADGSYSFANILPNNAGVTTDRYEIRFRHPQNSSVFGVPVSVWPNVDLTYGTIRKILLAAGSNAVNQDLPLDPGGVIYSSITRLPLAGATITISGPAGFDPASNLVGGAANVTQVTGTDGAYQYILLPGSGAPSGPYTLTVTSPAGYLPFPSALIPSCTTALTVGATPAPLLIQTSNTAPGTGTPLHAPASCSSTSGGVVAGAGSTQYYLLFNLTPGTSAAVVNNHIPIDPILGGAIIATKTTPLVNVKRGDLVPYTITMTNTLAATLTNINVRDVIPPGFKYRTGSGTLNGVRTEPLIAGRELTWRNLTFTAGEKKTFLMILVVGSGVSEGEYTNQVYALNNIISTAVSNIATATVRVIPDPTFDCADIIGKVFDDKNANGYQDEGEPGIANVRLATVRGLIITTDAEGRFHIPCPEIPNENRGSNFILKLDDRTLPSGYRVTTENPRVVRLTRGKMTKINFGATVHRVVRIDVNAAAFEKEGAKLQEEWQQKIRELEKQLRERPTVVRIAYRMGTESRTLVDLRIKTIREMLQSIWKKGKDCPPLVFEEEIVEVR